MLQQSVANVHTNLSRTSTCISKVARSLGKRVLIPPAVHAQKGLDQVHPMTLKRGTVSCKIGLPKAKAKNRGNTKALAAWMDVDPTIA